MVLALGACGAGCGLDAPQFAGTYMQMMLAGAGTNLAGEHLELWARDPYNDILRIDTIDDVVDSNGGATRYFPFGFVIRPAITMDDPCMIDDRGNLQVTAAAYQPISYDGIDQSAEEQAETLRARIAQLTPPSSCDGSGGDPTYHCGREASLLLGVMPYEIVGAAGQLSVAPLSPVTCETHGLAVGAGCISFNASAAERLQACLAYWAQGPLAYSPNPEEIASPVHGRLYGFPSYVTTSPPSQYSSIQIVSNLSLKGIQELWMTTEPDVVDVNQRGPVLLGGKPGPGGRDVVHIDLAPPLGSTVPVSGSASLMVDLNQYPDVL